jgi:hypothetical protein
MENTTQKTAMVKEVKNFAPPVEILHSDKNNIIHWEGYVGYNWYLKCQFRKNNNIGANIPAEHVDSLMAALTAMKEECSELLPEPAAVTTKVE